MQGTTTHIEISFTYLVDQVNQSFPLKLLTQTTDFITSFDNHERIPSYQKKTVFSDIIYHSSFPVNNKIVIFAHSLDESHISSCYM